MFMKKATTYYGIPTTRNGGCVNMAMKNDIGFNSCGNDSNGERENLDDADNGGSSSNDAKC